MFHKVVHSTKNIIYLVLCSVCVYNVGDAPSAIGLYAACYVGSGYASCNQLVPVL